MLKLITQKDFKNGSVFLLETEDGYPVEVTDTFLPFYTKDAVGRKQNRLSDNDLGSREDRWMIGVSTMSGCPCHCRFCATGTMKKCGYLTSEEIMEQVFFVLGRHENGVEKAKRAKEFKINYTRMGEPFLNVENLKTAIMNLSAVIPNTHHYVSTIGIKGADYSWIKGNITLQVSLHSLNDEKRDWLIPFKNKVSIKELGEIRTESRLKTTVNMTLVDEDDFDIEVLKKYFDPKYFFIKLSPINPNVVSEGNGMGMGVIESENLA